MGDLRAPHMVMLPAGLEPLKDAASRNFSRLKDYLRDMLARVVFLDGRLIEDVQLGAGSTTQVAHGLDRKYRGYFVVKGAVNADYPGEGTSDDTKRFLALTATAAQTVSLWVF